MASNTREQRIIATTACPHCGAGVGDLCRRPDGRGPTFTYQPGSKSQHRLVVHAERRKAWQRLREPQEDMTVHSKEFIAALKKFCDAGFELSRIWQDEISTCGPEKAISSNKYPFQRSFDEEIYEIQAWLEAEEDAARANDTKK